MYRGWEVGVGLGVGGGDSRHVNVGDDKWPRVGLSAGDEALTVLRQVVGVRQLQVVDQALKWTREGKLSALKFMLCALRLFIAIGVDEKLQRQSSKLICFKNFRIIFIAGGRVMGSV